MFRRLAGLPVLPRLDLAAQRASRFALGAQHVAGGELGEPVFLLEPLGLGALAGPRRPEQDNVHPRLPRSFAFLINPSY